MPLALLLSPDDQAVSAITGVLEEMSVNCERPLDGASAATKLNSGNFDLVLVDCENLPAAKLIFDVCRRGNGGKNPVPIAIVNGHAGLPTAFRLGAELILTKPVAKDQARSTIRAAVNRVKKEQPATPAQTAEETNIEARTEASSAAGDSAGTSADASSENKSTPMPAQAPAQSLTLGAAASSGGPSISAPATSAASAPVITMSAAAPATAPDVPSAATTATNVAESASQTLAQMSDDPVLAELERAEAAPKATPAALASLEPQEAGGKRSKSRGPLLAFVALALLASGLYAAWMTQPAFRTLAQPQFERLLALAAGAHPAQTPSRPPIRVKPAAQPPAAPATPSSAQATPSSQPVAPDAAAANIGQIATGAHPSIVATPATAGTNAPTAVPTTPPTIAQPSPTSVAPKQPASIAAPASTVTPGGTTPSGSVNKTDAAQNSGAQKIAEPKGADTKSTATPSPDAGLSAWNAAVILSSAGAERRLIHSVAPSYPPETRSSRTEGTVVLKALIDENGKVSNVQVVEGNAALAESAVNAVKQWRYRPYVREGRTAPFQTIVLIDFPRSGRSF